MNNEFCSIQHLFNVYFYIYLNKAVERGENIVSYDEYGKLNLFYYKDRK